MSSAGSLGILVNPYSGRDARRLFARAGTSTNEDKRSQVTRIVVGAAAAGVEKVVLIRDGFRIASAAVDALALPVECELLEIETTGRSVDGQRAAEAMRAHGCAAVVALGGDGTSRAIARAWPDVALLPVSTGTNNVFPFEIEATIAGAAAGLVAAGRLPLEEAGERAKIVRLRCDDGRESLALIDAALLLDDHPGSLLQFDPAKLARILLTRAEPASVGLSPIGGLLLPCGADESFGVEIRTRPGSHPHAEERALRAPISPGLYGTVNVLSAERVPLDTPVRWTGPGLLAFDGDREITLAPDEAASLVVTREGPWVIDPRRTLQAAAVRGLFVDMGPWSDSRSGGGTSCC